MTTQETLAKLQKFSKTQVITIDHQGEKLEFEVKKLSAKILSKVIAIEGMNELANKQKTEGSIPPEEVPDNFSNTIYPMIELVIPSCCIVPKVVTDEAKKSTTGVFIDDIPLDVLINLFNEILRVSGVEEDKKQEEVIKK